MEPRAPGAAPSMMSFMSEPAFPAECIDDGELAGAVDRVQAEQAAAARRQQALDLALGELVGRQAQHAAERDARAVERRVYLRGPVQRAVPPEERARRPRAAHVRLHRVPAMRLPAAAGHAER